MNLVDRIRNELKTFDDNVNVHDLPDIYHYWSGKYLKPILEEIGVAGPDDLFVKYMLKSIAATADPDPLFVSIGAGNCDTEVRIAKRLLSEGVERFTIECLELNPKMLERGRDIAAGEGVTDYLKFRQVDCNEWQAKEQYTAVIANQSLHHIVNLEGVFSEVRASLGDEGAFIISDMIGRNGHQRWPEALKIVHEFWRELPKEYKYNHQLKRTERLYENWDCSTEGFEGIRAQDILPLLIAHFNFEVFVAFGNVIDIFVDRGFGHNFDPKKTWDTDFIDRVHLRDEQLILSGEITPTHMLAVLKKSEVKRPFYSRGLTPSSCVREPGDLDDMAANAKSLGLARKILRAISRMMSR